MDTPFTDDEKRFVFAEMIKTSQLDVNLLANFVKASAVTPRWGDMFLPRDRSLNSCMRAVELVPLSSQPQKRRHSDEAVEPVVKRRAVLNSKPGPVPILPRPANGTLQHAPVQPDVPQPVVPSVPKKRGRPSRSDRNKDLHPQLPQKPPTPTHPPHMQSPTHLNLQRTILLAPYAQISKEVTSPARYSTSPRGQDSRGMRYNGMVYDDSARPRAMTEGSLEHMRRTSSASASSSMLAKLEPRGSSPLYSPRTALSSTLPPLLNRGDPLSSISLHNGMQAPSTASNQVPQVGSCDI